MTAEFAVVLPAVLVVLVFCMTGMSLVGQQIRLQDAAASVARTLARGGDPADARELVPGAQFSHTDRGSMVCVTARVQGRIGGLAASIPVTASSCALGGGR